MLETRSKPYGATWSAMLKAKRGLYPAYIENASFENLLSLLGLRCTRFKGGTPSSPHSGRHVLVMLPSHRYASVTNYDDFPSSLEFSLETSQTTPYDPLIVYMEDLMYFLELLNLPIPDMSRDGALEWVLPDSP